MWQQLCFGIVMVSSKKQLASLSPLEAKVAAAHFGLKHAQRRGFSYVIIEGDSSNVISAIKSFPRRVE